jgi:glycosyltransferase involved in cell wall biosynthesis
VGPSRRYDVAFYVPPIGALISPCEEPPAGGAETQVYLLSRALAARGLRVCVVAHRTTVQVPRSFNGVDVAWRPPPRWRDRPGLIGKLAEVVTIWRVIGALDAEVFVQRGTSMETGFVALAAKARRRRFVHSTANTIDFTWGDVADRKNALLYRLGTRLADAIVVQTPEQVDLCRKHFRREPVMIKSLAEPAELRTNSPEAFLWIAKLAWYKNPLAFVQLARAVPEARFRMVGVASEKDSAELSAAVERAAAAVDNLELLPPRPRSELRPLLDTAVAMVATSDFEGMPNTFLEGWARGVPALALAHDPDGVIEREGVGGFAGGSPARLAELARELWRSRQDQAALSARCLEYVRREHGAEAAAQCWVEALELEQRIRRPSPGRSGDPIQVG